MIYEIRWDRQRSNYTRIDEIESDKTNEASIRKKANDISLDHIKADWIRTGFI